jgi:glutathione S-transferase
MNLYYTPGACSLAPHIVAHEAGIPLALKKVDLKTKQVDGGGSFMAINPKGSIPALQFDNNQVLTEVSVVTQYLADQKPDSKLAPRAGTMERYRLQEWLNYISSELHKNFAPMFSPNSSDELKKLAMSNLSPRFEYLATQLAGKNYIFGDQFTAADAYLFTVLGWTKYVGMDLAKWPVLAQYVARIAARPKVQAAMKAEGLLN